MQQRTSTAPKQRKPSVWTHNTDGSKRHMFKNAGCDERGRLKLDYEELPDVDWGMADEWMPPARRPSQWN